MKSLANRLQNVIHNLVSKNTSAYVNDRFRSASGITDYRFTSNKRNFTDNIYTKSARPCQSFFLNIRSKMIRF